MSKALALTAGSVLLIGFAVAWHWYAGPEKPKHVTASNATASTTEPEILASPKPSPLPAASATATPAAPAPSFPPDESTLMRRLRLVRDSEPALAVELAREGNRRYPDSPDAPERTSILIRALAGLNRPSEARGEAERMVNHYPDSQWVREIEGFTGAHRHRNLRLDDAGNLEYYDP